MSRRCTLTLEAAPARRAMRIRAGWKAWARASAHTDIYFVDPRAPSRTTFLSRWSRLRSALRAAAWDKLMPTYVHTYIRDRRAKGTAVEAR